MKMSIQNVAVPAVAPVAGVAAPVAVQPVVQAAPAVVPVNVSALYASPEAGVAVASPGLVAVPPDALLENPEGPAPYMVTSPVVIKVILESGHSRFVSSLNGKNTSFLISY